MTQPYNAKKKNNWIKRVLLWSPHNKNRVPRYMVLSFLLLSLIWGMTIGYIKFSRPAYRSSWTLVLPGKGAGANVNLVDIGQTSTAAASPYSNSSTSPKANYKEFAMSGSVIANAAKIVGIARYEFGVPRIKLVDQTSLMYFTIEGNSPEQAQNKAKALHQSLMDLLDRLRDDEINQQEGSALQALEGFREKLETASQKLLRFQSESNLVSMSQFDQLVTSIEQLRREKAQLIAQLDELDGKGNYLQKNMRLSAKQASDSLVLQNDSLFQSLITKYSEEELSLNNAEARWGKQHPRVKKASSQLHGAKTALDSRYKQLVGSTAGIKKELLKLGSDQTRNKLLRDLVDFDVTKNGLSRKIKSFEILISELIKERNSLTLPASRLDELIRNHQVAEAIFTSALARTDTTKSDVFVSYPLVQVLDKPNLPFRPSSPNKLFAVLGATASTFFTLFGLLILWKRRPYIQRILKSA
ncbi:MAG: hypothetical protein KUG78_03035 [Kangiellaceae bacterium]|nr:hypothetical protein [Kangiellaceae bacterium]